MCVGSLFVSNAWYHQEMGGDKTRWPDTLIFPFGNYSLAWAYYLVADTCGPWRESWFIVNACLALFAIFLCHAKVFICIVLQKSSSNVEGCWLFKVFL